MTMTLGEAYRVLGAPPGCGKLAARRAYRLRVKALHPDLHPEGPERDRANEETRQVIEAYETLKRAGFPSARCGYGPSSGSERVEQEPESDLRPGDIGARFRARWRGQASEDEEEIERQREDDRRWRPIHTLWQVVVYTDAPLWQKLLAGLAVLCIYGSAVLMLLLLLRGYVLLNLLRRLSDGDWPVLLLRL
ncbi:MAG TPA: J domain-containing protein [Armatimonadota bacterium]|jgi:hypothetical protein